MVSVVSIVRIVLMLVESVLCVVSIVSIVLMSTGKCIVHYMRRGDRYRAYSKMERHGTAAPA